MKKIISAALIFAAILTLMASCGDSSAFDKAKDIRVVSREDGSGTRGAFIELFELQVKNEDGSKKDITVKDAIIAKQTDVMMTNIANDKYAIGYISVGSLNDTVKALQIDGVTPGSAAVADGTYKVSRPFLIAYKGTPTEQMSDFIAYIFSAEGQAVIAKSYVPMDNAAKAFSGGAVSGKLVVGGSSSVTPVMEKLIEAYKAVNPNLNIELQISDSSAGLSDAISGVIDIAMSSRELKDTELAELTPSQIAIDGIAVIVNKENPLTSVSKEQVKAIFSGESTKWSAVQ